VDGQANVIIARHLQVEVMTPVLGKQLHAWEAPSHVTGVAVSSITGEISVASCVVAPMVQVFGPQGNFLYALEVEGAGPFFPDAIASAPDSSTVFVVDRSGHRVLVFDSDGRFHSTFGTQGIRPGQFIWPLGIAVDPSSGNVLVVDQGNRRVQVFTPEGCFIRSIGHPGSGEGQFQLPTGVACDAQGNVLVADSERKCVQMFDAHGRFLLAIGRPAPFREDKDFRATCVALSADGQVYVADTNNRVHMFSLHTKE
jgi:DNA-binding beta-propeller fold protein YncE